jgi:hypothetical protein
MLGHCLHDWTFLPPELAQTHRLMAPVILLQGVTKVLRGRRRYSLRQRSRHDGRASAVCLGVLKMITV